MVIGKWAVGYFVPKKTGVEKEFQTVERKIKSIATEWKRIQKQNLEETPQGRKILTNFYWHAAEYTNLYWKLCNQRLTLKKGNPKKLREAMTQAENDFGYFWEQHQHYKNIGKKEPQNPLKIKVDRAQKLLEQQRKKLDDTEREYGKDSWQLKNMQKETLEISQRYLLAQIDYYSAIKKLYPQNGPLLIQLIQQIEQRLEEIQRRIDFLKDTI